MMDEIPEPKLNINTINKGEDVACLTSEGCSFTSGTSCTKSRKVAIIGAGPAGLCAARYLFAPDSGFTGCLYEQAGDLGGTWLYSENTGKDRFGLTVHSTLYFDLWTNLPKETMTYPGFEYKDEERSYLPACRVLQYLVDYADHYNLHPHIKFHHHVTRIAPVGNNWSVTAVELTTKVEHVTMFDAVMVCSGPNIIPVYPQVEGIARFSGRQLHSREYRKADGFEGKRVLVIGLGPSGIDITLLLLPVAKKVIISHNVANPQGLSFPSSVIIKPIVSTMQDKTIFFSDGTQEEVDVIIHCTGYTYHYPFLTPECGLIVDQYITPLYKHFINIEHPTMCLIGIPRKCPHQYMVDYQVRAFLNILRGDASLPNKKDMLEEMEEDRAMRAAEGQRKKDFHKMSSIRNESYFNQLAELGGLEPIPGVILKIFNDAFKTAIKDFANFRKTIYKIVDNENFTKISSKPSVCSVKFADEVQPEKEEVNVDKNVEKEEEEGEEIKLSIGESDVDEEEEEVRKILDEITIEEVLESTVDTVEDAKLVQETTVVVTKVVEEEEQEVVCEKLSQQMNCETIKVEAVVEMTPSVVLSDINSQEVNEENQNDINLHQKEERITVAINGGTVNIGIENNPSKPMCGDEIVKIIQTEGGGGCR